MESANVEVESNFSRCGNEWLQQWEAEFTLPKDELCTRLKDYLQKERNLRQFSLKSIASILQLSTPIKCHCTETNMPAKYTLNFKHMDTYCIFCMS